MSMTTSKENAKRKRIATDPIEIVNKKNDDQFIREHLCPRYDTNPPPIINSHLPPLPHLIQAGLSVPFLTDENSQHSDPSWTSWTHPRTNISYSLALISAGSLSSVDLEACYRLIEETSRADYEASTTGWKPVKKMAEMKSPELRYILVKSPQGDVRGFTSLMATYEEGEPVVYCYEIHLKPDLQRTGLGRLLMSFLESVAAHTPPIEKIMLTCFLRNKKALAFYKSFGFTQDPISPVPKKLRYGREFIPDYVIMSKNVKREAIVDTASR
ncbi:acyl-CoA N-acyltransferase [Nemania sp. FL0031]|nr:acyl-CoA N-acyltransferase [Nemania sp. FL0031]